MTEIDLIVNQFILEQGKLYTLPELYHQLEEKILSQTASIDEIGEIISTDASLSARILRIANSPLYGFRAEVATLNRALNLIGVKEVKNLVILDSLAGSINDAKQCDTVNMEDFWHRSVYLALIAKRLAKHLKQPDADRLFISAIMSRLGQLVCCSTRPEKVSQILDEQKSSPEKNEFDIENHVLDLTYNEVSAKILQRWKVPNEIIISIQYLHDPLNVPEDIKNSHLMAIFILHVATIYSGLLEQNALQIDSVENNELLINTTESYLAQINPAINQKLNIDKELIDNIFFEIEMDAMEILGIIFPDSSFIY